MATWPGSLPQAFQHRSLQLGIADNRLRSAVDVGPAKVRRRSSLNVAALGGDMVMTAAQKATFETFVNSTLGGGTLPFDFPDPDDSGSTIDVRFGQRLPVMKPYGAEHWMVTIELEILP